MTIDWNSASDGQGMVFIGSHSLFVQVYGPPRNPKHPVIIMEAGLGDSSRWWTAVAADLKNTHRVVTYDRSGLGRSEVSYQPRTAENIAIELKSLLDAANIDPPYILVGHSYAGILVREFLAQNPEAVAGLMLVDTNTERTHIDLDAPWKDLFAVGGDLSYFAMTKLDEENVLDPAEWEAIKKEVPAGENEAPQERDHEHSSAEKLAEHRQFDHCVLGDRPVTVLKANSVRDYNNIYAAGTKAGNGTEEQRANMRAFISRMPLEEDIQKEQLKLSRRGKWVSTPDYGHNIHATAPDLIAREIRMLFDKSIENVE